MKNSIYRACFVSPCADDDCCVIEDGALVADQNGHIVSLTRFRDISLGVDDSLIELADDHGLLTVIPPFCDIHFHWVQDLVCDQGKDQLLEWLSSYVFPEEAKFADSAYAKERAEPFFTKLLRCGTLSGSMYASIHENSVRAAFHHAVGNFHIGNVVMTANSPDYLCRPLAEFRELIMEMWQQYGDSYVITPRFALSCEPETLRWLGEFARHHNLWVQTHLSENKAEIISTLDYYRCFAGFEKVRDYLDVYELCGLLHEKVIFAHCVHLEEREKQALKKHGAIIAHCPTSNAPCAELGLGSGLLNYEEIENMGIPWALASDIGAGPWLSMLDVMKSFLVQNRRIGRCPSAVKALFRATVMGNRLLGFSQLNGFTPDCDASFVALPSTKQNNAEYIIEEALEHHREEFNALPVAVVYQGQQKF